MMNPDNNSSLNSEDVRLRELEELVQIIDDIANGYKADAWDKINGIIAIIELNKH